MSSPIDLTLLPVPDIIEELDFEQILTERKSALIALMPVNRQAEVEATLALESEPLTIALQENALRELALRHRINVATRAVMLAYAAGSDQDQLGGNFNTKRLTITPADPDAVPPVAAVMEEDADYQLRIQEAFDGLSVAGPGAAYEFFARSADGQVADARCTSPAGAEIVVSVLSVNDNGLADAALLAKVDAALSPEDVRPLGDQVTVQSAEIIEYEIEETIYVSSGPEAEIVKAAALANVLAFTKVKRAIGRSIYRSKLDAVSHAEGVVRVVIDKPAADIEISKLQAAYCTKVTINVQVQDD